MANYEGESIEVPPKNNVITKLVQILGETVNDHKRIEVDLSHRKIYAYVSNNLVFDYIVSTGNPWTATPRGEFRTWIKLRYQRMEGGSKSLGTYYNLPNVSNIMYFYNDNTPKWNRYGLHEAYWHNKFGSPMSHGCVNLQLGNAAALCNYEGIGTRVIIYGSTPT